MKNPQAKANPLLLGLAVTLAVTIMMAIIGAFGAAVFYLWQALGLSPWIFLLPVSAGLFAVYLKINREKR